MELTINFIGTGRLGKTLGRLLRDSNLASLYGIYNRKLTTSLNAIDFIGGGTAFESIGSLPNATIIFITTPDDSIQDAGLALSNNPFIKTGAIVVHCSGVLNSDILSPLRDRGYFLASIHPLHSFATPETSVENFKGTYCAIEGDEEATKVLKPLLKSMGAVPYSILKEKKAIYHAAGVFASNYLVTLFEEASSCLHEAGVAKDIGDNAILNIMRGTLANLEKLKSASKALTGPLQRGDTETVIRHMNAFENSLQKELYSVLGLNTLELTSHPDLQKEQLRNLFRNIKDRSV